MRSYAGFVLDQSELLRLLGGSRCRGNQRECRSSWLPLSSEFSDDKDESDDNQ